MKAKKEQPMQIEGHRSAPNSPSLSICSSKSEGLFTTQSDQKPQKPKSPLIARDYDSLDSDNYQSEGQEIQHIYLNNKKNNNNNNNDNMIDSQSVHNSEINMNMPQSPHKVQKKRIRKKRKRKRKNRKRKLKHNDDNRKAKKIKKEHINRISLISDDENASNFSYSLSSVNSKENPIYIDISDSDSDSDVIITTRNSPPPNSPPPQSSQPIFPDFPSPSPSPINNREEKSQQLDICNAISNMDLNSQMDLNLSSKFSKLRVNIQGNGNRRTRRPSPPPQPQSLNAWDKCNLNPLTKRGLQSDSDLFSIPTKEMISLVNAIKNSKKHLMYADTNAKNRLLALIVSIIEMISKQAQNNSNMNNKICKILLIAPRRHLALEARTMLMRISKFFEINCETLIGGMPTFECINLLSKGIDVITGTPGKLCDMISKKRINLNGLIAISFNGADELKSMREQMHFIIDALPMPTIRVIWCESIVTAHSSQQGKRMIRDMDKSIENMSDESKQIDEINKHKKNACKQMKKVQHIVKYIRNVKYDRSIKYDALYDMLRYYCGDDIIVYFNTKHEKNTAFEYIKKKNEEFFMLTLDGEANNQTRKETIELFRHNGGIFFVTDLMNDNTFENVIVINFHIPKYNPIETYVKRVGSSNACIVFNLTDEFSVGALEQITQYLDLKIITYHQFSRDRRHHPSYRNKSIVRS